MGPLDRTAGRRPQSPHGYLALLFVAVITFLIFGKDTSRHNEEGAFMPLVANNAASRLAASIGAPDTTISIQAGTGAQFPSPTADDWFPLTLIKPSGEYEIVHCTARSADVLTVVRAREGTGAKAFSAGDRAELRLTAQTLDGMLFSAISKALPPGMGPVPWSLPDAPDGWIFADGSLLPPETPHQALRDAYIAAGFPYGQDGVGNPYIPDCRGRVTAGLDNAAGRLSSGVLGATLGAQTHTLSVDEMPGHSHTASTGSGGSHLHSFSDTTSSAGSHTHSLPDVWSNSGGVSSAINYFGQGAVRINETTGSAGSHTHTVSGNTSTAAAHTHTVTVNSRGGGAAHNNVQPTLVTNMIIKT